MASVEGRGVSASMQGTRATVAGIIAQFVQQDEEYTALGYTK